MVVTQSFPLGHLAETSSIQIPMGLGNKLVPPGKKIHIESITVLNHFTNSLIPVECHVNLGDTRDPSEQSDAFLIQTHNIPSSSQVPLSVFKSHIPSHFFPKNSHHREKISNKYPNKTGLISMGEFLTYKVDFDKIQFLDDEEGRVYVISEKKQGPLVEYIRGYSKSLGDSVVGTTDQGQKVTLKDVIGKSMWESFVKKESSRLTINHMRFSPTEIVSSESILRFLIEHMESAQNELLPQFQDDNGNFVAATVANINPDDISLTMQSPFGQKNGGENRGTIFDENIAKTQEMLGGEIYFIIKFVLKYAVVE